MSYTYHCPKCRAVLNPNVRVVLVAHFEGRRGLVLLSPKLGDYKFFCDKGFCKSVQKGNMLEFCCPVCAESLTSPTVDQFTELLVVNGEATDKEPYLLRFSRVCEEHATFLYDGETVREFGEDAAQVHRRLDIDGHWGW